MRVKIIFILIFILSACAQEVADNEPKSDSKVVTEEDLIREAEEILNSEDENYWDFSDPKYEEEPKN